MVKAEIERHCPEKGFMSILFCMKSAEHLCFLSEDCCVFVGVRLGI